MIKNFYQSKEWKAIRLLALKRDDYKCVKCGISVDGYKRSRVDHILELKARPDLALTLSNLQSLCPSCDNNKHAAKLGHKPKEILGSDDDGYARGFL